VGETTGCGFETLKGIKHTVLFQQQVAYNNEKLIVVTHFWVSKKNEKIQKNIYQKNIWKKSKK
jgi:hypothetical protein